MFPKVGVSLVAVTSKRENKHIINLHNLVKGRGLFLKKLPRI